MLRLNQYFMINGGFVHLVKICGRLCSPCQSWHGRFCPVLVEKSSSPVYVQILSEEQIIELHGLKLRRLFASEPNDLNLKV